jgi:hypothetical protein
VIVPLNVPPLLAMVMPLHVTVPFVPTDGALVGAGLAETYVNPEGSGSLTDVFVVAVCELFVTLILKTTVSPRLTTLTGAPPAVSEIDFVIVSAAVRTETPVVSVPVRLPTFVAIVAVLKNVPPLVPAATVKLNVFVDGPGIVADGEKFQVIVPDVPDDDDGVPSVPPVLVPFVYVNPVGSVSLIDDTVMAVLEVLLTVSV